MTADVVVIGAGIVGLATASALRERGVEKVVVLEAEVGVARHQSGRNSGVIHSGLYYRPGSAKARLCGRGRETLYRFCEEHGIAATRTGKLVVATTEDERPRLDALAERGRANGLRGLELLDEAGLRSLEPRAAGVAALHVRETGIVDFAQVARVLTRLLGGADEGSWSGAGVQLGCRVIGVAEGGSTVRLETTRGCVEAGWAVSCAGLHADRIAREAGLRPDVRIVPFRGDYFRVDAGDRPALRRPIYPVPDPDLPFLGVHVHPTVDGGLEAGPNALPALSRSRYRSRAPHLRDAAEVLAWPGFWRMAARHARTGVDEVLRALSRRRFARAVGALVPDVRPEHLSWARCGLRAQAVSRDGTLVDDFHFERQERVLHVLNAPSPGATASLAIGEEIADRLLDG